MSAQTGLSIGSALEVKPNSIYPLSLGACTTSSTTCASGSFTVLGPEAPLAPTAVISAATTLSVCDDVTLDGANSYGGGIYPLAFSWSASAVDSVSDAELTGAPPR